MPTTQAGQRIALHEQERLGHVRPTGWTNPVPAKMYDIVVVGAGPAGLEIATLAVEQGARVAVVEKTAMGGASLNAGRVALSALLESARSAVATKQPVAQGLEGGPLKVDFESVMERVSRLRAGLAHLDGAHRFAKLGVDVFFGEGGFTGPASLKVGEAVLAFKRACVATGARPSLPSVPGLADSGFVTAETIWSLTLLPKKLVVLGGGATGCEFAQAFARLGSQVFLIEAADRLLPREDPDASVVVRESLENDGVRVFTGARVDRVIRVGNQLGVSFQGPLGSPATGDQLLVATGRVANLEGLKLDAAGITADRSGIQVDDQLRTTNPRVYAAGGCTPGSRSTQGTHALAKLVVRNALDSSGKRVSRLVIPTCTYTDPEVAQVGLSAADAQAAGLGIETFHVPFTEVERALLDGATRGFVKVSVLAGTDELVGATVVGAGAGELVTQVGLAITAGLPASVFAEMAAPYPTRALALRRIGELASRRTPPGLLVRWRRFLFRRSG